MLLRRESRLGHKAMEAANNICGTMGQDLVSTCTMQRFFNNFKNGDIELDDVPRSSRPMEPDVHCSKQLIEQDARSTLRCLAEQLEFSHNTMENI